MLHRSVSLRPPFFGHFRSSIASPLLASVTRHARGSSAVEEALRRGRVSGGFPGFSEPVSKLFFPPNRRGAFQEFDIFFQPQLVASLSLSLSLFRRGPPFPSSFRRPPPPLHWTRCLRVLKKEIQLPVFSQQESKNPSNKKKTTTKQKNAGTPSRPATRSPARAAPPASPPSASTRSASTHGTGPCPGSRRH